MGAGASGEPFYTTAGSLITVCSLLLVLYVYSSIILYSYRSTALHTVRAECSVTLSDSITYSMLLYSSLLRFIALWTVKCYDRLFLYILYTVYYGSLASIHNHKQYCIIFYHHIQHSYYSTIPTLYFIPCHFADLYVSKPWFFGPIVVPGTLSLWSGHRGSYHQRHNNWVDPLIIVAIPPVSHQTMHHQGTNYNST